MIAYLLHFQKLDTFYYVGMSGISVGGQMLSIPASTFAADSSGSGGIIVDSGTAVTRLRTDAYESLHDAFVKGMTDLPRTQNVALFDTCYDLSRRSNVQVPTVGSDGSGVSELRLPAKNYLIPVDSDGTFCFTFAPTGSGLSIIGNVQQQGTRVGFDLANRVVGVEFVFNGSFGPFDMPTKPVPVIIGGMYCSFNISSSVVVVFN